MTKSPTPVELAQRVRDLTKEIDLYIDTLIGTNSAPGQPDPHFKIMDLARGIDHMNYLATRLEDGS